MNDQDLYGKTPAGFEEVRGRALKLPQRLRTMLIMVDGSRTVTQLREAAQTLDAPADFLDLLQGMGLIVLEGGPSALTRKAGARAQADTTAEGETTGGTPASQAQFRATLKFMNDSAVDLLGLRAFFFTLKLEKCYSQQDLLALLPEFNKAIAKSSGAEMARMLEERARQMLRD
jgi:hypothetical protein